MTVLAVNAGSSTLKFALYPVEHDPQAPTPLTGSFDGLAGAGHLVLRWTALGQSHSQQLACADQAPFEVALRQLRALLQTACDGRDLRAVAHRVVHGGSVYRQAVRVDDLVLAELERLCPLAPLHQPNNLHGIRAFAQAFPEVPQVACFDTAFHASLPEVEYRFAIPEALAEQGVRRYGFHGLSYQYLVQTLAGLSDRAQGRVVMAHLGSGASVCASLAGRSVATSMGFSALDGLMMGTRCGALDAGVLLHLLAQGWDAARLQAMLYRESGLLGVSGLSSDMRTLRASSDARAGLAIAMFTHRVVRETGAMTACLGGMDALVFTGGIGEHDALLRADVCDQLAYLGIALDAQRNADADGTVACSLHAPHSGVEVWVVPTDEGRIAAQAAVALLQ
ncbi:acetate/propionate family kinase [Rhodoferax sp.]|jgi:acetate kinase|uniref:acetate/propionate family kinase n=1 Tax=Rhodoferax sp. TaxID=50421 RepID=UPI003782F827